jgi:hypothetical protein
MSINDATPEEWDRVSRTGEPTFEEYMKRLNSKYVYDSTEAYKPDANTVYHASEFADCWDRLRKEHPALEPASCNPSLDRAMLAAHNEKLSDELKNVTKPYHYNTGNIECIEAIEESMSSVAFKGYLKGNCLKYLWRYDYKGKQVEDLQKAGWYLNKLTKMVAEENS